MRILALPLLSALLALASSVGSQAQMIYSLAGDFNTTSDSASNIWAYGVFTDANNPSTFTSSSATVSTTAVPGMAFWFLKGGTDPNIEKNIGSSDINGGTVDFRPGTVSFGPYQGPAVAQFTVPTTGVYNIAAAFQTDQIRGSETSDGTAGMVYFGNVLQFNETLQDPGAALFGTVASFSADNVTLTAGEKLYFVVGNGAFTTQVDATISEVPEPSTSALVWMGLGLSVLVICRKSRRNA